MNNIRVSDYYLEIPQGQLFIRQWAPLNNPAATPLILFHDSLGSVELWRDFPVRLVTALNRPVIAYDRLGFGKSSAKVEPPPATFITEEAETHFPLIAEQLELQDFYLMGHSVGAVMALLVASGNAQCKGVISLSAPVTIEERTLEGIRVAKRFYQDPEQFNRLKKWHGEKSKWILDAWTETWLSEAFAGWNIFEELEQIECPVLAIHGDSDEYGSTAFPEAIRDRVKGMVEMEILEGCGHVPQREKSEQVISSVVDFLGDEAGVLDRQVMGVGTINAA